MKTILTLSLLAIVATALGVDYLTFDASSTSNVTYRLRIRTNTNSPTYPWTFDLGTNRFVGITNGPWGAQSYSVVSLTTNGIESISSNEVRGTNRPGEPVMLRIVTETNTVILEGSFNGQNWKQLGIFTTNALELAKSRHQMLRANVPPPTPQ